MTIQKIMLFQSLIDLFRSVISDFVSGILWFTFGFLSQKIISKLRTVHKRSQTQLRRKQVLPSYSAEWLIKYYRDRNRLGDLLSIELANEQRRYFPFLTKSSWHDKPISEDELIVEQAELLYSGAKINQRILNKKKNFISLVSKEGDIWNDPLLCVSSISSNQISPRLTVEIAEYFQYLSACGALEEETYETIRKRRKRTPLRDKYACNIETLSKCGLKAHGLGMQVVFLYKDIGGFKILIQERSFSTAIYGGAMAVVPIFGCQPVSVGSKPEVSLLYNFLREFYEELYANPDVQRPSSHLDPTWFYEVEPISTLLSLYKSGGFVFEILGFGFDALNGEVNIAALAFIKDSNFMNKELRRMKSNWEIKNILIKDIDSTELRQDILNNRFQPGSVFAITKAIQRLNTCYRTEIQ